MIALRAGRLTLELRPETGGAITAWHLDGRPLLRPSTPEALASLGARGAGCYPLVPYSNRLAGNRFTFAGQTHTLPATLDGQAIHGVGWRRPWIVLASAPARASLAYDHAPDSDWPFPFRAEQHLSLEPGGLTWRFAATNLAAHPAPMGFGLHPFFPRPPGTRLRFAAERVWRHDARKIPSHATSVPADWDFAAGREVASAVLDHCFTDWGGRAEIALPHATLTLAAEPAFRHLIVYIPPERDFFAVEPVTNLTDGLNRIESEPMSNIIVLRPGERREASVRLDVAAR
ncbi:MAG: aldose 1-epimerase [Rhodospirillales bacterium]|nr:aldose 1-epimerase [Rhodospirillales bacterium]